jgi:hypothetical protein
VHCRNYAVQLHRARESFEDAGIALVLIGQATPRHAAHFRRTLEIDLPILADEQRDSYRAVGARVGGVLQVLGPAPLIKGVLKARKSGIKGGKPIGDPNQLGAAVLVRPDGSIAWSYISKDAADSPPLDELLEAAPAAAASA